MMLQVGVGIVLRQHGIREGVLATDDSDHGRSKKTKRIFKAHKIKDKSSDRVKLNAPPDFGIIIIRPGDVYGPGCTYWIVQLLQLMRERVFVLANGGRGVMNHVYVDNLIEGIFLAIEKEAYREAFNITDGQETSCKEYFTRLAKIGDLPVPFSLPADVIKFIVCLRCFGQSVVGQKPDVLPQSVNWFTRPYAYSIAKARIQLAYEPKIDLEEGMRRTREWLQKTDLLKASSTTKSS